MGVRRVQQLLQLIQGIDLAREQLFIVAMRLVARINPRRPVSEFDPLAFGAAEPIGIDIQRLQVSRKIRACRINRYRPEPVRAAIPRPIISPKVPGLSLNSFIDRYGTSVTSAMKFSFWATFRALNRPAPGERSYKDATDWSVRCGMMANTFS